MYFPAAESATRWGNRPGNRDAQQVEVAAPGIWCGRGEQVKGRGYSIGMGLVVLLLILALLFGGVGLFAEGLKWLLIIALVLLIASFFTGYRGRRTVL